MLVSKFRILRVLQQFRFLEARTPHEYKGEMMSVSLCRANDCDVDTGTLRKGKPNFSANDCSLILVFRIWFGEK